ncbi:MAG: hypothetical protein WD267_02370 [Balneolales bacterium]
MKRVSINDTAAEKIGNIAGAIGRGLFAGFAGTVAMTIVQVIEMKITKRSGSTVPADGLEKIMPLKAPENEAEKMKLAQITHFAYGTAWGIPLGIVNHAGISATLASISHFGAVWGTAMILLPKQNLAPPITEWDTQTILTDAMHHMVYASVAGLTYHAITRKTLLSIRQPLSIGTLSKSFINLLGIISLSKFQKSANRFDKKTITKWYKKDHRKPLEKGKKRLADIIT